MTASNLQEAEARVKRELTDLVDEERVKREARLEELELKHKMEVELLKEEFSKVLADAKGCFIFILFVLLISNYSIDHWQQERIQLETQIQRLHREQTEFLQNQLSTQEAETKLLVATEVDKTASEKTLQTEEKLHTIQLAESEKLREEFQKSSDDFRELLKMDLALLRNDERLLWEKERQAIREEEVCKCLFGD